MSNLSDGVVYGNDTLDFFKQIFHGADAGTVVLWLKISKTESETYPFPLTDLVGAAAKHDELALRRDVYVARGLQGEAPAPGERGKEPGVIFVGGLFADADTREGPHDGTPAEKLPADANEVLALIAEAKLPPPTLLVHTGGGCHPHWLYNDAAMILTPEERAAEKMLSKALQKRLRDTFEARGYKLDNTQDLARVCKAPGSLNLKTAPDLKPVTLIHQGERYDRAEMAAILAPELGMSARGVARAGKGTLAATMRAEATKAYLASGKAKPDDFGAVLAGCAFIQHCDASQEQLPEPWWYKMVGVVARTVDGRRWVHEMSKRYPGYEFNETEEKIDHALEGATGPTWCSTVAEDFEGCARCPFRASIRTPLKLANQGRAMVAAQQGVVFVVKGRSYLHLASGEKLDTEEFADSIAAKIGKNPHGQMMQSPTMPKVMHRNYRAGVAQLILPEPDGTISVNLWQRGGVIPAAGDYQPILDFLARFLPDTLSREHVVKRARERNQASMAETTARLQRIRDESVQEAARQRAILADPVARFIAETRGSTGYRNGLQTGLRWIAEGRPEAIGGFVDYLAPDDAVRLVPVLIEADASPEFLREAIRAVVLFSHKSLPSLVQTAGGRKQFAAWCRRAKFELPDYVIGNTVTIARGTVNCTVEQNASGMHWSIGCPGSDAFDGAAFFASGWPNPTVVVARVPRSALVYFVTGILPYEVLPEDVPARYEVVTDRARIMQGAVRFAYHRKHLKCSKLFDPVTDDFDQSAAELIDWWEEWHQAHGFDPVVALRSEIAFPELGK